MPTFTPNGKGLGNAARQLWRHDPKSRVARWDDISRLAKKPTTLPQKTNNVALMPSPFDQGSLGSCTANAACALLEYYLNQRNAQLAAQPQQGKHPSPIVSFSRLFNYFFARAREGTINLDSGADIIDNFASLADEGVCPENLWMYSDLDPGAFLNHPDEKAMFSAHHHLAVKPYSLNQAHTSFQTCLAEGNVFEIGIEVHQSFYNDHNGDIPLPKPTQDPIVGDHAVVVYDYEIDPTAPGGVWYDFQNSWGTSWGKSGRGRLPGLYMINAQYCFEYYTLHSIA